MKETPKLTVDPATLTHPTRLRAPALILKVGLIAGTLDITDALLFSHLRGIAPTRVFQYIASGLIGTQSFQFGMASVSLGVVLHYAIAFGWTGIFYAASRQFTVLRRRPVVSGVVYGFAVYVFMNFVVLPLSSVPRPVKAMTMASRINGVLAVVLFIGLTISLLIRRNEPAVWCCHPANQGSALGNLGAATH